MPVIDLRSDTVTKPTPAMREAMEQAEVGNAAWGEDPTVNRLEEKAARAVGKEAALFVPSGTMGNQVAIKVWTAKRLAPEVVCEARAHVYVAEAAAIAAISNAQVRTVQGVRGALPPEAVDAAIQPPGVLKPATALVCIENTHNYAGGAAVPLGNMRAVREVAQRHNVPVHLDGARIFNAAHALGVSAREIAEHADSVQFCFSKGLAAPIGSVVCGARDFIEEARKVRQYLGGALRQAGVIAAAAEIGLDQMVKRLPEDHRNARAIWEGVRGVKGLRAIEPDTNIVILDVAGLGVTAAAFAERAKARGVLLSTISDTELRAITHNDVSREDVPRAVEAIRAAAAASG